MAVVSLRPQALVDLLEIWAYIADDSIEQADKFAEFIESKFQSLARRPGIGRRRPELMAKMRSHTVGRYVVFYLPRFKAIEVVRVLHGSRDIDELFENDL
jgi:toxin ParE1/3/4